MPKRKSMDKRATRAQITFEDHPDPLDPRLISDFFYLVSGCVNASKDLGLLDSTLNISEIDTDQIQRRFETVPPSKWRDYFSTQQPSSLGLHQVTCKSPIDVVLYVSAGSVTALTLAIILSGGKVSANAFGVLKFKASLPPIGKGIERLRKSLGLHRKDRIIGFGIQSVTVTLSEDEFKLLMQRQAGSGGFQHFMKKLQSKVNQSTRTLTLSVEDLDRIQSYKANPSAGGFQGRYNRIFGRHLEDNQTLDS